MVQITFSTSLSAQLLMMSPFDDPRSQLGSLHFAPNVWQVTTGFPLFLHHVGSLEVPPPFSLHTFLRMRSYPELCLKSSNPSICTSLLCSVLDALLFMELMDLHLLLPIHGIPDCLRVLLAFYFPLKTS